MCLREPTNTGHNMNYEEIGDHEMLLCDPNMKSVYSHTIMIKFLPNLCMNMAINF